MMRSLQFTLPSSMAPNSAQEFAHGMGVTEQGILDGETRWQVVPHTGKSTQHRVG